MRFGSLFSGIGGLDLGLERAGMECAWQVEIDPWCRKVLTKHWPDVPKFGDVKELTGDELERVDLIAGGFPCQDVSVAGKRAGLDGSRSGLWSEYIRLVRVLRPRFVLVENVPGLFIRGLGTVLGDLAASGYDAEWDCIPAAAVGAPHLRWRVFILAHANGNGLHANGDRQAKHEGPARSPTGAPRIFGGNQLTRPDSGARQGVAEALADPGGERLEGRTQALFEEEEWRSNAGHDRARVGSIGGDGGWAAEPDVGRVANGVPHRMDRLRGLGNAVVPQVAQWIGERIMQA